MTYSHEELREGIGCYVLEQLGPEDELRRALAEHLETCETCAAEVAELTPLKHALRTLKPDLVRGPDLAADEAALSRVSARVDQALAEQRQRMPGRRWRVALVGALAGAAAVAGVVLVLPNEPAPAEPTVLAVPRLRSAPGVEASAGVIDHTWGVEVKLEADGLAAGRRYQLEVIGRDGTAYRAGAFLGIGDKPLVCRMTSGVLLDDARRFRVVDDAGSVVIRGALPA